MDNLDEYLKTQNKLNGIILKLLLEVKTDQLLILANYSSEQDESVEEALPQARKALFRKLAEELFAKHSDLPDELKDLLNLPKT